MPQFYEFWMKHPMLVGWSMVFITYGLPILFVIWFIRHLIYTMRERRMLRTEISKLRMDTGKIADELQQIRTELNTRGQSHDSSMIE